ncbi:type II toxin-antitoxin system mRNA interferase toxin, RelE/StbE family [Trinickia dabaoshanensis]|uniref:Type II toxin-antitoxin system mRNA interferase toxin, RelE/StbE family n=1 Tax=Trinickia dabaoshanensis TaxID=564714 RepID=A0A2N7W110_9BURK|nr:type II toxin-antitoxin system RelE/ParE family toxin [Trinickia dabaoshanensis]PMS23106.1 type II toxin-antitoxin system mRNA interferase toxin, RelE/StbE family [Trinickia dabaoshanensis]
MLPIVWLPAARRNLAAIIGFIAERNPSAARRIKSLIEYAVLPLAEHPNLFRAGRVANTREVVAHPNYVVIYRVTGTAVLVLRVLHARQQYPATGVAR